jgi:hypothetical protein
MLIGQEDGWTARDIPSIEPQPWVGEEAPVCVRHWSVAHVYSRQLSPSPGAVRGQGNGARFGVSLTSSKARASMVSRS